MKSSILALALVLSLVLPAAAPAAEAVYEVDTVHSTVLFKVKHLGVSNSYGRFNAFTGTVSLDDPAKGLDIQVKADSVDTANKKRDDHLKGPDFLNVRQFPTITFKGKQAKKTAEGKWEVAGDLTLHGTTKPITVQVEQTGTGKGQRGEEKAGFEATFTIQRSDYGMKFMVGPVGDAVQVTVSIEGTKK